MISSTSISLETLTLSVSYVCAPNNVPVVRNRRESIETFFAQDVLNLCAPTGQSLGVSILAVPGGCYHRHPLWEIEPGLAAVSLRDSISLSFLLSGAR